MNTYFKEKGVSNKINLIFNFPIYMLLIAYKNEDIEAEIEPVVSHVDGKWGIHLEPDYDSLIRTINQFKIIKKRFPCIEPQDCKLIFREVLNEKESELIKKLANTDGFFHSIMFIEPDEYKIAFVSWDKLWGPYQDLRTSLYLKFRNLYFTMPYAF
jgi:hypothetical protein